ncbi:MAG: AarF/ABC1/UbiB kinase family protein [Deltaproteobacteria bacterium]|nr:MAG: AarF/ABC1/UbiB kinase family protein [Deltaproteobacteria bacterium]
MVSGSSSCSLMAGAARSVTPPGRSGRCAGSSSLAILTGYPRSAPRSTWYPADEWLSRPRNGRRLQATRVVPPPRRCHRRPAPPAPVPPPSRARPTPRWCYWVTFVVIFSYLFLRLRARFHSDAWVEHALRATHLRNARRIERAICELQGLFIKVGQLISIMTNFLPEEFRRELEGLQDAVPPRPYADIEARIREELQRSPAELFARFDQRPIASASIGQVHLARLLDGTEVAVKVQYPDIEEVVRRDLATLRRIFWIIGWFVPYQGLGDLYREIRAIIMDELDYHAEAHNAERIAANFVGRSDVGFPHVVHELSTARVLVTHFEAGCKITDRLGVKQLGLDRGELARQVVEIYCQQIFTDGVYHADPHPGNLLVRPGLDGQPPTIVFLDFGAVAEIPGNVRQGIVELLQGALTRDTRRIVGAMKQMGFVARGADEQMFEQVIEYFHEKFQENISLDSLNLKDIKFDPQRGLESVADLRRMDISLRELSVNFHIPKEIIVLERTLLLLMGLCTELDPTLNPMTVIRPYLERFVLGDEGDWSQLLVETSKDLVMSVTALPAEIRKFMRLAHAGELQLRFKNLEAPVHLMYRLGHQFIFAIVGIAGAAIAIVLEGRGDDPRADWGWWTARIAGALLVWSWWTSRALLRKR